MYTVLYSDWLFRLTISLNLLPYLHSSYMLFPQCTIYTSVLFQPLMPSSSLRLLRLRNPWAKCSWRGPWSDGDIVWSHHPQLREDKLPMGGELGIFWIEMRDVYRYVRVHHCLLIISTIMKKYCSLCVWNPVALFMYRDTFKLYWNSVYPFVSSILKSAFSSS